MTSTRSHLADNVAMIESFDIGTVHGNLIMARFAHEVAGSMIK